MTPFSLSSVLDKAAGALYRSAESDVKSSKQKERLAKLALDPALRARITGLLAQAAILGDELLARIEEAFDDETPAPAEKPKAEPKPETKTGPTARENGAQLPPDLQSFLDGLRGAAPKTGPAAGSVLSPELRDAINRVLGNLDDRR